MTCESTQNFQTDIEEATNIQEDEDTWDTDRNCVEQDDEWETDDDSDSDSESESDSDSGSKSALDDSNPSGEEKYDECSMF